MRRVAVAAVAVMATSAHAQPVAATEPLRSEPAATPAAPAPTLPPPLTAADVANAPRPGDEDGRTDPPEQDSVPRRVARTLLYIPRMAVDAALMPVYSAFWAEDRYHLDDLYYRVFFNADHTIGLYPTGTYSTGHIPQTMVAAGLLRLRSCRNV